MNNFKPAVSRDKLFILAGLLWTIAGAILCQYAVRWLLAIAWKQEVSMGVMGILLTIIFYQASFKKIVKKNIERIHTLPEKPCVFAFASWKSYLMIAFMMTIGIMLRHSSIPKSYLAIPYETMGSTLLIGSVSYYRSAKK